MNTYTTEIQAICPLTGDLLKWAGPNVKGISFYDAQEYCNRNGLGYCKVVGLLVSEIPCDANYKADFTKKIDYDFINN